MLQFRLVDYILHTWNTHCGIARCFACLRTHHLGVCVGCSWYPLPTNLPYQCHVLYLTQTYPITRFGFRATDHRWSDIPCLLQIITITHFVTSQRDNFMRYFECLLNGVRFYYIDIPTGTRIEFFPVVCFGQNFKYFTRQSFHDTFLYNESTTIHTSKANLRTSEPTTTTKLQKTITGTRWYNIGDYIKLQGLL